MKEILRIRHGQQDIFPEETLYDYNLEIYEGDILYIQGNRGSGLRTLVGILAGDVPMKSGALYLWDKKAEDYSRNTAMRYHICVVTDETDMVMNMSVTENLEAVCPVGFPLKLYRQRRKRAYVQQYLKECGIPISADDYVFQLSSLQQKELSIMKAKMRGAKLIGLNMMGNRYEGKEAEQICRLIKQVSKEDVSFVIFSEGYSVFAEIANRIQMISEGRERKEWYGFGDCSDAVRRILFQEFHDSRAGSMHAAGEDDVNADPPCGETEDGFLGLFDYEWEREGSLWSFLRGVKTENPEIWDRYIGAELCGKEEEQNNEKTVIIPMDSAEMLLDNLSVADNIILSAPKRVCGSGYGIIKTSIRENIRQEFCRHFGIDFSVTKMEELDWLYRKILAIYRWELMKPDVIFLENPFNGLDGEQKKIMADYLKDLKRKGIRIILLSRSMENLKEFCRLVIITKNGKSAKITPI